MYSYLGVATQVQYARIGDFCSIADGVRIGLGQHPLNLKSTHPAFYAPKRHGYDSDVFREEIEFQEYREIIIGDDVWIGTNAIILDGCKIGSHAVVAAGAVVTKDVPEYAIVGGVPARIIKYRQITK